MKNERAENLRKFSRTTLASDFVEKNKGHWNHQIWLEFCSDLEKRGYTPIDFDQVGALLETIKHEYQQYIDDKRNFREAIVNLQGDVISVKHGLCKESYISQLNSICDIFDYIIKDKKTYHDTVNKLRDSITSYIVSCTFGSGKINEEKSTLEEKFKTLLDFAEKRFLSFNDVLSDSELQQAAGGKGNIKNRAIDIS